MMVAERLELTIGPAIQNPVLDTGPGILSLVLSLVPNTLDLVDQSILVVHSALLGLNALQLQVCRELVRVPVLVRFDDVAIPVLLH